MNSNHGTLEKLVMNVIWDNISDFDGTMSVSQVTMLLNKKNPKNKRAYTTVKTILDRLYDKGLLDKKKEGKKFVYIQTVPRKTIARQAVEKLAKDYFFNDIKKLSLFVDELIEQDEKSYTNV